MGTFKAMPLLAAFALTGCMGQTTVSPKTQGLAAGGGAAASLADKCGVDRAAYKDIPASYAPPTYYVGESAITAESALDVSKLGNNPIVLAAGSSAGIFSLMKLSPVEATQVRGGNEAGAGRVWSFNPANGYYCIADITYSDGILGHFGSAYLEVGTFALTSTTVDLRPEAISVITSSAKTSAGPYEVEVLEKQGAARTVALSVANVHATPFVGGQPAMDFAAIVLRGAVLGTNPPGSKNIQILQGLM